MKTIYTILLVSGLYSDGYVLSSTPIPMSPTDCISVAQGRLDGATCVRLPWPYDQGYPTGTVVAVLEARE